MACPSDERFASYLAGELPADEETAVRAHCEQCAECRKVVAVLASTTSEAPDLPLVAGRYRVLRILGEGGMGTVYEALDERIGRVVAVKSLRSGDDGDAPSPEDLARFRREAAVLGALHSPHVVQVLDVIDGDEPMFVMERLDGEPLRAVLARDRTLPAPRALDVARQLLVAVDVAHQAGIVHRDVKPENTFVIDTAAGTLVKLLDFGLAKPPKLSSDQVSLTGGGLLLGTIAYMAPEQARAERATPAVDVYAVGTILFEMIAGSRPYLGAGGEVLEAKVLGRPPRSLSEVAPDVPAPVAALVGELLAPAATRPAAARAALDRLTAVVDALPPPPRPPAAPAPRPQGARLRSPSRHAPPPTRSRAAFVGALFATLLVGAGVLGGALALGVRDGRGRALVTAPTTTATEAPVPSALTESTDDAAGDGGDDAPRSPPAPRSSEPPRRTPPAATDGASCYCRRGGTILCPTIQERHCRCVGAAGSLCRSKLAGTPARCQDGSFGFEHLAHGATCEGFERGVDLTLGRALPSVRHAGRVSCEVCTRTPPPMRAPPGATCSGYLFEDERLEGNWDCRAKP